MSVFVYMGGPVPPAEGEVASMSEEERWYKMFEWVRQSRLRRDRPNVLQGVVVGRGSDDTQNWFDIPCVGVMLP